MAAAIGAVTLLAGSAAADIRLTSKDGSVSVRGELVSFEDGNYVVNSVLGEITVAAALVTCEGEECPEVDPLGQVIRVAGSPQLVEDLMPVLVDEYALQADADLRVRSDDDGGSGIDLLQGEDVLATFEMGAQEADAAFQGLLRGEYDMIVTGRPITNSEVEAFLDAGLGDLSTPAREAIVAQDGLLPVVSPDNPVGVLSDAQLDAVFSGQVTNWSQLGGGDAPINLYLPSEATAVSEIFYTAMLEPNFSVYAASADRLDSVEAVSDAVAGDAFGVGVVSSASLRGAKPVSLASQCGLSSAADSFGIKSEDYPLSRRIYIYTAARENPSRLEKFVNSIRSTEGQAMVEQTSFVGLGADVSNLNRHGVQLAYALTDPAQTGELQNLRAFAAETIAAQRLSTTFRFASGSSRLDNKAAADADRLLALLNDPAYRDREVLLIGFTDSIGRSDVNTVLSVRRAEQVLETITATGSQAIDPNRFRVIGFGAAYPVACNTSEAGRQLNRRVEVWVR
ncbi:MAG: phosphate ABC transporter substrate-binding/OmpA family protein [Pseudomonadota bacterium]